VIERLDFAGLSACADAFDAQIVQTPQIDHFCSTAPWVLPAHAAFSPDAEPFISRSPHGFVALKCISLFDGRRVAVPLEAGWGLASPLAGANSQELADQLAQMMMWRDAPPQIYLSGLRREGPQVEAILRRFKALARFGVGQSCERRVCAIDQGLDAWLTTRSPKFRGNLRRARRRATAAGYRWRWLTGSANPAGLFERIMAIESRSWKGKDGVGVDDGAAREFYRLVVQRLAATRRLRVLVGTLDGADVAYVLGGILGDTFRGLQMSYATEHRRFELGNVAQIETIAALVSEGIAVYDLGTEMDYKARWAPPGLTTMTLAVFVTAGSTAGRSTAGQSSE
jgi:CelD/BcsL family acetyltransferase involved in cellulose biosynthesis